MGWDHRAFSTKQGKARQQTAIKVKCVCRRRGRIWVGRRDGWEWHRQQKKIEEKKKEKLLREVNQAAAAKTRKGKIERKNKEKIKNQTRKNPIWICWQKINSTKTRSKQRASNNPLMWPISWGREVQEEWIKELTGAHNRGKNGNFQIVQPEQKTKSEQKRDRHIHTDIDGCIIKSLNNQWSSFSKQKEKVGYGDFSKIES